MNEKLAEKMCLFLRECHYEEAILNFIEWIWEWRTWLFDPKPALKGSIFISTRRTESENESKCSLAVCHADLSWVPALVRYPLFVPLHVALQGLLRCLVFSSAREGNYGPRLLWGFGIKITHRNGVHGSSKRHEGSLLLKAVLPSLSWNWDSAWTIFSLVSRCLRAVTEFHTRLLPLLIMAPAASRCSPVQKGFSQADELTLPNMLVHQACLALPGRHLGQ